MSKAISTKDSDGTDFYFDQWNGVFMQAHKVDLTSINFHCDESDLEQAKEIAVQEGLTSYPVQLFNIEFSVHDDRLSNGVLSGGPIN